MAQCVEDKAAGRFVGGIQRIARACIVDQGCRPLSRA